MIERIKRIDKVIAVCVAALALLFGAMIIVISWSFKGYAPENTVAQIETSTGIIEVEVDRYWGPGRNNAVTIRDTDGNEYTVSINDVIFISKEINDD